MSDVKRPDLNEGRSALEGGVELYVSLWVGALF